LAAEENKMGVYDPLLTGLKIPDNSKERTLNAVANNNRIK